MINDSVTLVKHLNALQIEVNRIKYDLEHKSASRNEILELIRIKQEISSLHNLIKRCEFIISNDIFDKTSKKR